VPDPADYNMKAAVLLGGDMQTTVVTASTNAQAANDDYDRNPGYGIFASELTDGLKGKGTTLPIVYDKDLASYVAVHVYLDSPQHQQPVEVPGKGAPFGVTEVTASAAAK
jgi:hypothetical protein